MGVRSGGARFAFAAPPPPIAGAGERDAYRDRGQAGFQGCAHPSEEKHAVDALECRRVAGVSLPACASRLPRRADRRREHGHDRHVRNGPRARAVRAFDRTAQALRGRRADCLLQQPRPQVCSVLFHGDCQGRRGEVRARHGGDRLGRGSGGAISLHRRREWLHRGLRPLHREGARAIHISSSWPAMWLPER